MLTWISIAGLIGVLMAFGYFSVQQVSKWSRLIDDCGQESSMLAPLSKPIVRVYAWSAGFVAVIALLIADF
jgi:hypothetical protein